MKVAWSYALASGVLAAALAVPAQAQTAGGSEAAVRPQSDRRAVPDYDGRPDAPPTPGEVALWIPRIALFPVWVVAEYVLRRPLAWIVSTAEENQVPERLVDVFTFGPNDQLLLAPTFSLDLGIRPNVGLIFRADDFLFARNTLSASGAFGGLAWLTGRIGGHLYERRRTLGDGPRLPGGKASGRPLLRHRRRRLPRQPGPLQLHRL